MKTNNPIHITPEEVKAVTEALKAVQDKMTFVQPLTREQRNQLPRLRPKAVEITGKRLAAAGLHRDSLPPSFDYRQFERDASVVVNLGECQATLQRMLEEIQDTVRVLSPRAVQASKAVLGHLQVAAADAGEVHTTVSGLKLRSRPGRKPAEAEASTTVAPAGPGSAAQPAAKNDTQAA